jgi:hypothetical protein
LSVSCERSWTISGSSGKIESAVNRDPGPLPAGVAALLCAAGTALKASRAKVEPALSRNSLLIVLLTGLVSWVLTRGLLPDGPGGESLQLYADCKPASSLTAGRQLALA